MNFKRIINRETYQNLLRFPEFNYSVLMLSLVFTLMAFITSYSYRELKNEAISKAREVGSHTSENIKQYLLGLISRGNNYIDKSEVVLLNYQVNKIKRNSKEISKILDEILPDDQEFELLILSTKDGHYLANSLWNKKPELIEKQKDVTLTDRDYFNTLAKDSKIEFYISNPIQSKTTGKWILVIAKRRFDLKNNFIGEDHVTVSIEKISNAFRKSNLVQNATIALYNGNNELLARYPNIESKLNTKIPVVEKLIPFLNQEKANFIGHCPIDKIDKIYGYSHIPEFNLRILWGVSYDQIVKSVEDNFKIFLTIELILLFIAIFYLINKYKNLERIELLQIQESNNARMAMIGEFAAGVAHEINNPLAIIVGNANVLLTKNYSDDVSERENRIKKILETTERITKIVKSLKNLGRSARSDEFIEYSVNDILSDVQQIVNIKLRDSNIEFNNLISDDLKIKCTPSLISQVFLNLFSNSIYAISNLSTKWIEIKSDETKEYIFIHFTDSGHGIPQNVQKKLMSTFYTTKPVGEGTGLGLSICKRILKEHNGDIFISEDSTHTRFTLKFPKHKSEK
jgi:signal transduction histidine kinase